MERLLERVASSCSLCTMAGTGFGSVTLDVGVGVGLEALLRWNWVVVLSILCSCSFETPEKKEANTNQINHQSAVLYKHGLFHSSMQS